MTPSLGRICCNEDEYVNNMGKCELKPILDLEQCFFPTKCGKTGIASLFDKSENCGGEGLAYCNFSSGEIVTLSKNYVKVPANRANPPRGQGSFPHAGRVFGYNYVVYEPDADNSSAIGFSKLAKFNNDGSREESELYWDTCSGGRVLERYSDPSLSTDTSSVFSKTYNCECLNIDYPNYNLAICKTPPGSGYTPQKVITYTPSGEVYKEESHNPQDVPPQSAPSQDTESAASPTSTADGTTGSTDTSAPTSEDDEASEPADTSETVLTQVQRCTDGTILGECSTTEARMGYKCENLMLVPKCGECGCQQHYACDIRTQRCCLFGLSWFCI